MKPGGSFPPPVFVKVRQQPPAVVDIRTRKRRSCCFAEIRSLRSCLAFASESTFVFASARRPLSSPSFFNLFSHITLSGLAPPCSSQSDQTSSLMEMQRLFYYWQFGRRTPSIIANGIEFDAEIKKDILYT